ncbi:hypothetical protein THAOC_32473 [Thalassiosira oceanica]|uniref:SWIM-type domain-containing protein n=1 Tax=Thalassiosira oceanica TaxID=159749 RepID=K0RPW1_THAOC|nr:hypothetical protein THAOC_32473 [Thalassiosira oceanica]|eukprot:EJK48707.1 hypothetical protein THAOC_32473 [Thalassiosira oceanica]
MTINGASATMYSVDGLRFAHLYQIAKGFQMCNGNSPGSPKIYVDCNNAWFRGGKSVASVVTLLIRLAVVGFVAVPVCDGTRPIGKQATPMRAAAREKARIESFVLRAKITELQHKLNTQQLAGEERADIEKELADSNTALKRKETASQKMPSRTTLSRSCARAWLLRGCTTSRAATADPWQKSISPTVLAGDDCIEVMNYTRDEQIKIRSTSLKTLEKAISYITSSAVRQAKTMSIRRGTGSSFYPIFEGVTSLNARAAMGLILGCDAIPKGLPGAGPRHVSELLEQYKVRKRKRDNGGDIDDRTLAHHSSSPSGQIRASQSNAGEGGRRRGGGDAANSEEADSGEGAEDEAVQGQCDGDRAGRDEADRHEADEALGDCDEEDGEEDLSYREYMNNRAPKKLAEYCREFRAEGTVMEEGPAMSECCGVGGRAHRFLTATGCFECVKCKADGRKTNMCQSCLEKIDDEPYCLGCYAGSLLVPEADSEDARAIAEKRAELSSNGVEHVNECSVEEVNDLYEQREVATARITGKTSQVPFPLYPTEELDKPQSDHWTPLIDINLKEGGSFIGDPDLKSEHAPKVLEFFASLVDIQSSKKRTDHKVEPAIYKVMPETCIEIASKSRLDSGYRVMCRAVRHNLDSKCPPVDESSCELVIDSKGEIGIRLGGKIPASMKKNVYDTELVCTATELLCCKCGCQSGSQDKQRILCVHILAELYKLVRCMFGHRSEHILLYLVSRVVGCTVDGVVNPSPSDNDEDWMWRVSDWSDDEYASVKRSIIKMMSAAGEVISDSTLNRSIVELLDKFHTCTEQRKEWAQRCKVPPDPAQLGPISGMSFDSAVKQTQVAFKIDKVSEALKSDTPPSAQSNESKAAPESEPTNEASPTEPVNYLKILFLVNAFGYDMSTSTSVGQRLIVERAKKEMGADFQAAIQANDAAKIDIKNLVEASKSRSKAPKSESQKNNLQVKKTTRKPKPKSVSKPPRKMTRSESKKPPKKKDSRAQYKRCKYGNCGKTNRSNPELKFLTVPCWPVKQLKDTTPIEAVTNHYGKVLVREETLRRLSLPKTDMGTHYICEDHQFVTVKKSKTFRLRPMDRGTITLDYNITVPTTQTEERTLPSTTTKGLGSDRKINRLLHELKSSIADPALSAVSGNDPSLSLDTDEETPEKKVSALETENEHLRSEVATQNFGRMQDWEVAEGNERNPINPVNAVAAGLEPSVPTLTDRLPFSFELKSEKPGDGKRTYSQHSQHAPKVTLDITDAEVHRRTGFKTRDHLLTYVSVVCNGDISKIMMRSTVLTWFEEWFAHFEFKYGRTITRLIDLKAEYGPSVMDLRKMIQDKYSLEVGARDRWPTYVSHEEDCKLRKSKWDEKYGKFDDKKSLRVVMWDMTNIPACAFSDPNMNRITYSVYYAMNCFKGGVFVQLCGWMGTAPLWTGAVSDTDYNKRAGYIKEQHQFARDDLVMVDGVRGYRAFLNIYDKGYRAKLVAHREGEQLVLQPDFAESDRRFNRTQTLRSASVASDRGGNERAVNVAKRSWYLKRGFQPHSSAKQMNHAWMTWSFQSNFMYDPVL